MYKELIVARKKDFDVALEAAKTEAASIRTGRANPSLVEDIQVDYMGARSRIKELASISAPEPRLIVIQPWDSAVVPLIEKAIRESKLGISPVVDGKIIRLPIPELSEERRKELGKLVKKMSEDGRVAIRHVRRDSLEDAKKLQKDSKIIEDDLAHAEKEIQKLTDQYIGEIDKQLAAKEKDIMTV